MGEFKVKMMPGQEPYTEEEWAILQDLFEGAGQAEEMFELDDLERASESRRRLYEDK